MGARNERHNESLGGLASERASKLQYGVHALKSFWFAFDGRGVSGTGSSRESGVFLGMLVRMATNDTSKYVHRDLVRVLYSSGRSLSRSNKGFQTYVLPTPRWSGGARGHDAMELHGLDGLNLHFFFFIPDQLPNGDPFSLSVFCYRYEGRHGRLMVTAPRLAFVELIEQDKGGAAAGGWWLTCARRGAVFRGLCFLYCSYKSYGTSRSLLFVP